MNTVGRISRVEQSVSLRVVAVKRFSEQIIVREHPTVKF